MRVLNRRADLHEEMEPLRDAELVGIAEVRQRQALDEFHHKERRRRAPGVRGGSLPGVQQPGNVRVIHERDGLPFRLEA